MQVQVASKTEMGPVRTNNEDNLLVDEELGLFIVADGMGGHNAGEVASLTACETIHKEIKNNLKLKSRYHDSERNSDLKALRRAVESAVLNACKAIYKQASRNPDQMGMGTTCTVMYLVGHGKGILAHVGDSRLYVARAGQLHQLSEDHTFVNELVKRGAITKDQARNHPQGNVLSRAMGPQPSVSVDTMIFDIDPGDTYLLCSDGLYTYYPDPKELLQFLQGADVGEALAQLLATALGRGGHDNATGVVLRIPGQQSTESVAAQQRIAILKRIPIFSHLSYNELVKVVGLTLLRRMEAGEDLCVEGEMGDELYVVLSGEVDVLKGDQLLVHLKAGSHIGEMAMVDNAPRSATVRTTTQSTILVMRREEFFGLIRTEAVIATKLLWSFVQVLSGRLRETNEALHGARSNDGVEELDIFEIEEEGAA